MDLPHQMVGQFVNQRFDEGVRKHFFKGMEFAAPVADPAGSDLAAPSGMCTPTCMR